MYRTILIAAVIVFSFPPALYSDDPGGEIEELRRLVEEGGYSFTVGNTSVMQLSPEERAMLRGFIPPSPELWKSLPVFRSTGMATFDPVFDWRDEGGVTSVKNQSICGSCWAFACVAQLESHASIYDGVLLDLSEQQMIDCNVYGSDCDGGTASAAYQILMTYGGVLESCIGYTATDGNLCGQESCDPVARMSSIYAVANNIDVIKEALLKGPVFSAFKTHSPVFDAYDGGCYDYNDLNAPDHAVLIVGWDDTACGGAGAWICKNSWGTGWGDDGFFYAQYGVSSIGLYAVQVTYPRFVDLVYPNGGEEIHIGDLVNIEWTTDNVEPDSVRIALEYGTIGTEAAVEMVIASGLTGTNLYVWEVPELYVEGAIIEITAFLGGSIRGSDVSGGFDISLGDVARQNYPNPFSETTTISYSLTEPGKVRIAVYNSGGALVKIVEDITREAGTWKAEWDGTAEDGSVVSSGVYFCRIETGTKDTTKKIIVLK
ncbi:MAG: T9SS type A sorting domain-containing protein [Candidatus Krumholzibacteriota bacterium]|nr:T9SS type A sorting domain-containing protein [Candidatus Krumholzibacteriota bacterium]